MSQKAKKEGGFKASMWDLILEGAGIFSERDEEARKSKVREKVSFGWMSLQRSTKWCATGLVKFVSAVA